MSSTLHYVTHLPELWKDGDPVRPELDVGFKTSPGRGVFGLQDKDGMWKAFLCFARTTSVPKDLKELEEYTHESGHICIPYTVWSLSRGSGREIIDKVVDLILSTASLGIEKVVTLSPRTEMARKFHLRNGATVFRENEDTVNFEYPL